MFFHQLTINSEQVLSWGTGLSLVVLLFQLRRKSSRWHSAYFSERRHNGLRTSDTVNGFNFASRIFFLSIWAFALGLEAYSLYTVLGHHCLGCCLCGDKWWHKRPLKEIVYSALKILMSSRKEGEGGGEETSAEPVEECPEELYYLLTQMSWHSI